MALQSKTVEALVELVTEEIPEQLVVEELRERIHDLNHRLEGQGMSLGQFLGVTGRSEEEFLEELRAGALQSVKADLALRALVEAEADRDHRRGARRGAGRHGHAGSRWTPTRCGASWNRPDAWRRYARTDGRPKRCAGSWIRSSWSTRTGSPCHGTT